MSKINNVMKTTHDSNKEVIKIFDQNQEYFKKKTNPKYLKLSSNLEDLFEEAFNTCI